MISRLLAGPFLGALIVTAGCGSARPASAPAEAPVPKRPRVRATIQDADELMRHVLERYRELESYEDEGVALSYWTDKPTPDELHFKTYFRRPGDFRFEWVSHHPYPKLRHIKHLYVVWSNSQGTFSYWDRRSKIETEADLGSAIAAATGVSQGAITTIPGVIVGRDNVIWSVEDVHDLTLLAEAEFENIPCVRVRGALRRDSVEIWIGRDDFLIRRIITTHPLNYIGGKLPKSEEIRRNVQFDHAIPDATFEFTP